MEKLVSALGLLIAVALGAIAWIGMPATDVMASPERPALSVCAGDLALDEGYGITRHVTQICPR